MPAPVSSPNPPQPAPESRSADRILALDLLRGYFILIIASIHLHYYPSLFGAFDGQGKLWVSEAEGFFFISGLLLGIIRRKDLARGGLRLVASKSWARAGKLFAAATVLTLLYTAIARTTNALGVEGAKGGLLGDPSPLALLWQALTLQHSYGWADFLIYYVAFIALTPLAVWLLARRLWWAVLLSALGGWVLRWAGDFGSWNPHIQWQVFFFMGIVGGYHWQGLQRAWGGLSARAREGLQIGSIAAAALVYAAGAFMIFALPYLQERGVEGALISSLASVAAAPLYDALLLHNRIGLLRPLLLLIVFAGMYAFVTRYQAAVVRYAGWLLIPYGRNSLYVYIMQSLLLFIIPYFVLSSGFFINSLLEITVTALILIAVRRRFLFRIIPR